VLHALLPPRGTFEVPLEVPVNLEYQLPGVPGLCTPAAQAPLEAQEPV